MKHATLPVLKLCWEKSLHVLLQMHVFDPGFSSVQDRIFQGENVLFVRIVCFFAWGDPEFGGLISSSRPAPN